VLLQPEHLPEQRQRVALPVQEEQPHRVEQLQLFQRQRHRPEQVQEQVAAQVEPSLTHN
jgi:hypothetical protein